MVHLNELHDTYAGKGFTVLAVTNEEREKVDEFVKNQAPTHPIVIEAGDSLAAFGGGGFPSSFLIAPDGTLAWSGHPAAVPEDLIEELLTKAELFPDLPKAFSAIRNAMEKGKFHDAQKAIAKAREAAAPAEEDKAWLDKLQGWLDWTRSSAERRATKALEASDFFAAWKTYDDVAKSWKGDDFAADAEAKAKELLADKDKKAGIEAGRKLDKIKRKIRDMSPKKALKQLEPMTGKKYAETAAGKQAAAMIEALEKELEALK